MKIFLTGGSGLLGTAFQKLMTARKLNFIAPTSAQLDLLDLAAVDTFIRTEKPDLIIHCAAYTAVDQAEINREDCWSLNVEALQNLLAYEIPLVHFSTDYVFNTPVRPIPVDHPRDPLNYYGQTKAQAEELLESSSTHWWNIRTTWLYGEKGEGFPNKIKQLREKGEELKVVDDQFGRKTLTTDLAKFVLDEIIPGSRSRDAIQTGHHHYQSPGPIHTWYDWACELVGPDKVSPIQTDQLNLLAARPENSVLV